MSLLLIGLLGSWYFISATSSWRNASPPSWSPRSTVLVAVLVATEPVPLTGVVIRRLLHTRTSTPVDVDRSGAGAGRPTPGSVGRTHGRGRASPRPGSPGRRPSPACCWAACCWDCELHDPPVSRSTSSREQLTPADCRSRRRSGSAASNASRPAAWAPRRSRETTPLSRVTCTCTGPRFSGERTTVMVWVPSAPPRSTATCGTSWAATAAGCAGGAAGAVTGAVGATAAGGESGTAVAAEPVAAATGRSPSRGSPEEDRGSEDPEPEDAAP